VRDRQGADLLSVLRLPDNSRQSLEQCFRLVFIDGRGHWGGYSLDALRG